MTGRTAMQSALTGIFRGTTPPNNWLCFTSKQAGSWIQLDKMGSPATVYLESSLNGYAWKNYSIGSRFSFSRAGSKVYFRAKDTNQTFSTNNGNYYVFTTEGQFAASGSIQTLLDRDGMRADAPSYCYYHLFWNCFGLLQAPDLPATDLNDSCYRSMFNQCGFTEAPDLPAKTLASNCYRGMFSRCSLLQQSPHLASTALASNCYYEMFLNCTSLSSIEVDFSAWSPANATQNWVQGVGGSGVFKCPASLPQTFGDSNIPSGWSIDS